MVSSLRGRIMVHSALHPSQNLAHSMIYLRVSINIYKLRSQSAKSHLSKRFLLRGTMSDASSALYPEQCDLDSEPTHHHLTQTVIF